MKVLPFMTVALLLFVQVEAQAHRAIPDNNLSYPVFISLKDGSSGTGFYLNDHKDYYLVTAKHVLIKNGNEYRSDEAELFSYSSNPKEQIRTHIHLSLGNLKERGRILAHPSEDVILVKIGSLVEGNKVLFVPGAQLIQTNEAGIVSAPVELLKRFDDVLTGNRVFVFGYPVSIGIADMPQIDYDRPLITAGIIAGQNHALKTLVLDAPVYPGNSGGPVVEVEDAFPEIRFRVVGIVTQFVPYAREKNAYIANSGYSIAVPSDHILELLSAKE